MINEWTDRLPESVSAEIWQRQNEDRRARRIAALEGELKQSLGSGPDVLVTGIYETMRSFLALRDRMFPDLPSDPAWKLLVTLAATPEGSPKANISGICYGADVPMTTALRYIAAMEHQGIIERISHPDDRRQIMLRLSPEGKRRMESIAQKWMSRIAWLILPLVGLLTSVGSVVG